MRGMPSVARSLTMGRFPEIRISAGSYIGLALGILLLPLDWLMAGLLAAGIHELCHLIVIWFCGGRVEYLHLNAGGAQIGMVDLSAWQEALCALAGPLGGLVLVFFGRRIPRVAVCALLQSAYNLLPLYPLDGGRVVKCVATIFLAPDRGEVVIETVETVTILGVIVFVLHLSSLFSWNVWLIMGALMVLLRKIPCKRREERVQ